VKEQPLVADLVSVEIDPYRQKVKLNKGSGDGVAIGQPLVDAKGALGQIVQVDPWYSTALLIADPTHALPVQVNRNGIRAIAVGTGAKGLLEIAYLPNNADVLVGDLLVTSGLGGIYPAGYPAAIVISVETNPRLEFAQILARPTADLDRAREVLILRRPAPRTVAEQHP
jgi:rod shape-determining protein MreC